jgi:hypothetical protein
MQIASENLEAGIQRRAVMRGWRALALVVLGAGLLGTVAISASVYTLGTAISRALSRLSPGSQCDGCKPAPRGSAVRRAGYPVGVIQQVATPRAGRPLPMFLATMSGLGSAVVVDSARTGQLVARLDQDPRSVVWTLELVPRDSVRGAPVGRLVMGPGHPPLSVWGDSVSRP